MFGIGGWEFVLIAVLALLLFGPDRLPQFARTIGRFMRDFKRYQDLMESTIRGEIFAADPTLQKDPFDKGKEFREKVAAGGFSKPAAATAAASETSAEEGAVETTTDEAAAADTSEPGAAEQTPDGDPTTAEAPASWIDDTVESAMCGEIALDDPVDLAPPAENGEGEADEA